MMDDKRDFAEAIMLLEGIFGTEFPLDAENLATTSNVVDWFESAPQRLGAKRRG